jgi:hypothetical protein
MIGLLAGTFLVGTVIFSIIQFAFLWAGQGAVETAAHFAGRKFALNAREDLQKAKASALAEASSLCRNRPGGRWESTTLTSIQFLLNGTEKAISQAQPGEAYKVRLTHGIELIVPWVNRMLFLLAPIPKVRVGDKYFLFLHSTRWVTVE